MADLFNNFEKMYSKINEIFGKNDWLDKLEDIDTQYGNKDGTLVKTEFSYFAEREIDFKEFGCKSEKEKSDLINRFWSRIDKNQSYNHVNGTRMYDQNALDSNEIDAANKNIKKYQVLEDYCNEFFKQAEGFTVSTSHLVDSDDIFINFKSKVKESLTNHMISSGKEPDALREYFDSIIGKIAASTLTDLVAQKYLVNAEAVLAADHVEYLSKSDDVDKDIHSILFSEYGTAQAIINRYIQVLKNDDSIDIKTEEGKIDLTSIVENAQNLINEYLGLAFPDGLVTKMADSTEKTSPDVITESNILNKIGYSLGDDDLINDLQKQVLKTKFTAQMEAKITLNKELAPDYLEYKKEYDKVIEQYVSEYISSVKQGEYNDYYNGTSTINAENITFKDYFKTLVEKIKKTKENEELIKTKSIEYVENIFKFTDIGNEIIQSGYLESKQGFIPTYYVANDGTVKFVNYNKLDEQNAGIDSHGVFDNEANSDYNKYFEVMKEKLEESFSDVLKENGFNRSMRKNLFNLALFITMSDTTLVESQYKFTDWIGKSVLQNYTTLLCKAIASDDVKEYITKYDQNSILAGRSPAPVNYSDRTNSDVNKFLTRPGKTFDPMNTSTYYYRDDTTGADGKANYEDILAKRNTEDANPAVGSGDDWVEIAYRGSNMSGGSEEYSEKYNILYMDTNNINGNSNDRKNDDIAMNSAMNKLFADYLSIYETKYDQEELEQIFRNAEATAFENMKALNDCGKPNGTKIYGYAENMSGAESDNYDTMKFTDETHTAKLYNAGTIILNVMYEFESIMAKKVLCNDENYNDRLVNINEKEKRTDGVGTFSTIYDHLITKLEDQIKLGLLKGTSLDTPILDKDTTDAILEYTKEGKNETINEIRTSIIKDLTASNVIVDSKINESGDIVSLNISLNITENELGKKAALEFVQKVTEPATLAKIKESIKKDGDLDFDNITADLKYDAEKTEKTKDDELNGQSIKDIIKSNAWVNIGSDIGSGVEDIVGGLQAMLKEAGLNETKINNVAKSVIEYFSATNEDGSTKRDTTELAKDPEGVYSLSMTALLQKFEDFYNDL